MVRKVIDCVCWALYLYRVLIVLFCITVYLYELARYHTLATYLRCELGVLHAGDGGEKPWQAFHSSAVSLFDSYT